MDEDAAEEARNEEELWSVLVDASNWIGGISRMSQGKSQKGRARSATWQHENSNKIATEREPSIDVPHFYSHSNTYNLKQTKVMQKQRIKMKVSPSGEKGGGRLNFKVRT